MNVDYPFLGKFTTDMLLTQSIEEKFCLLERCVYQLGFDGIVYTLIPKMVIQHDLEIAPVFKVSDGFPLDFLEEYEGRHLEKHDFTIRRILDNKLDVMDWGIYDKQQLISRNERRVIRIAESHRISNAISIPTLNSDKAIAGASVISREIGECFQQLKQDKLETLIHCVREFHTSVYATEKAFHSFLPTELTQFNDKELMVMYAKYTGMSMKALGESKEGISRRYAEKLTLTIRERYGNIPMNQLLYYLGQLEII